MGLSYNNILVAVDGSESAEFALNKAIEIAKRNDASLHLVYVVEHYRYPGDSGAFKKFQEKFGTDLLEKYQKYVRDQGIEKVNIVLEFGSPKVEISKNVAKVIHADLIICGAKGLNAVERMLIGSVSENVVRSASCDVLIVRDPQ